MKIGINGFGRIGRLVFRALWDRADIEITHINEIAGDSNAAAHLLEFDSVHGLPSGPRGYAEFTPFLVVQASFFIEVLKYRSESTRTDQKLFSQYIYDLRSLARSSFHDFTTY